MSNFIGLSLEINPFDPWADVISQELSEIGFESFEQADPVLNAYIKEALFEEKHVMELLDSFEGHFTYTVKIEK